MTKGDSLLTSSLEPREIIPVCSLELSIAVSNGLEENGAECKSYNKAVKPIDSGVEVLVGNISVCESEIVETYLLLLDKT